MNAPGSAPTSARALGVMFGLVVLVALVLLTRSWHASMIDRYEFRQLQTAVSTHWIAEEGWSLDYPTPLFGPPWSVPMEFPTYQVIVAAVHNTTGLPLEESGRLVGILFLLAALPALHDLLSLAGLRHSRRLVVLAVVLTSPVYLFYARTFMIETTALCCAVWFLALLRRALEQPRAGWILATTAAAVLAALTKITTFLLFGLPAAALVIAAWRARRAAPIPARPWALGLAAVIPATVSLGLTWWWIRHGDAVKDSNPFTGFLTSRELSAWNFGPWSLRLDWSFWVHLQETIVDYNLAEGAIAVALLLVPFAPRRTRWLAAIGVLAFFTGPLVFANLYHIHDYYYAANSLFLLSAAGLMLAAAWDDPRLPRGANWLALVLVLAFQLHAFYRGYYSYHRRPAPTPPALADVMRAIIPPDGVVLIYGWDWNATMPYYARRRAIMVPDGANEDFTVLGHVTDQLPPRRIAALLIRHHPDRLDPRGFARIRTNRFHLSSASIATSEDGELYLPEEAIPAAAAKLAGRTFAGVSLNTQPPADPNAGKLQVNDISAVDFPMTSPRPTAARSMFGLGVGEVGDGRKVILAHPDSELSFTPPPGATRITAEVGLAAGAYAPDAAAVTDGVSVEIFELQANGIRRKLYARDLNPVKEPGDRGPQPIAITDAGPFSGTLVFKITPGPKNNLVSDWAYWGRIEIR